MTKNVGSLKLFPKANHLKKNAKPKRSDSLADTLIQREGTLAYFRNIVIFRSK